MSYLARYYRARYGILLIGIADINRETGVAKNSNTTDIYMLLLYYLHYLYHDYNRFNVNVICELLKDKVYNL